ncbi:MAG: DNA replication/repair protein RecF [Anaerolineaceae bacterium]|nr:DNA replication/repair protein RecF [Anaerolineaceae bacterium]
MRLNHLTLTNYRAFSRLDMDLPRRILLLVGANAQGKTSLLEAIYFFSTFTSIQASNDRQLINFLALNEPLAVTRLLAEIEKKEKKHQIEIRLILDQSNNNGNARLRKEILIDGVKRSAHQAVGLFNAVIFLPNMTRIIEGGPDERRRYLNLALAQTVPGYAQALSDYAQAISQRNALLKQLAERSSDPAQLDYWDELTADRGAFILFQRIQALEEMQSILTQTHRHLTRDKEILHFNFQSSLEITPTFFGSPDQNQNHLNVEKIKSNFLEELKLKRREEIARGVTTIGPHRDELRFLSNQIDLGIYGSRGQIRTALLSLKLAEVEWMFQKTGEYPVLLLDETLAELDVERRADLLSYLNNGKQAILTTTDLDLFEPDFVQTADIWQIHGGLVKPEKQG